MASIAKLLKDEIQRISQSEVKSQIKELKKSLIESQREIASLKRQFASGSTSAPASKTVKVSKKKKGKPGPKPKKKKKVVKKAITDSSGQRVRFSAAGMKKHRAKLGVSAADYATLVGVSPLTVYNWEHGKSRPRAAQLIALAEVRGLGKREAAKRLGKKDK